MSTKKILFEPVKRNTLMGPSPGILFAIIAGAVAGVFLLVGLLFKALESLTTDTKTEEERKQMPRERTSANKAMAKFLYYACLVFAILAAIRLLVGPELVAPLANRSRDLDSQHPDFLGKLFWALEHQTIAYILFGGSSTLAVIFYFLKPTKPPWKTEGTEKTVD